MSIEETQQKVDKLKADYSSAKDIALSKFKNDPLKQLVAQALAHMNSPADIMEGLCLCFQEGYNAGSRDMTRLVLEMEPKGKTNG